MLLSFSSGINEMAQFFTVLVLFLIVLAVTYFTTRWIADYQKSRQNSKNIEVIETSKISQTKYIQIVRIGERYLAIAVCKDTVSMLTELKKEDLFITEPIEGEMPRFSEVLEKIKIRKEKK